MAALRLSLESAIAWAAKQQELAPWVEGALAALAAAGPEPEAAHGAEPLFVSLRGHALGAAKDFHVPVEVVRIGEPESRRRRDRERALVWVRLPGGGEDSFQARDLAFSKSGDPFDIEEAAAVLALGGAR